MKLTWILAFVMIANVVSAAEKDTVRVLFMSRKLQSSNYNIVLYDTGKKTFTTLWTGVNEHGKQTLAAHEPSGLVCWMDLSTNGKLVIECCHLVGNKCSIATYAIPSSIYKADLYSDKERFPYLHIDRHGNNIFWTIPPAYDIWATSLITKHSKIILRNSITANKTGMKFGIDDINGYFFGGHVITSETCWSSLRDTTKEANVCAQTKGFTEVNLLVDVVADPIDGTIVWVDFFGNIIKYSYINGLVKVKRDFIRPRTKYYMYALKFYDGNIYWVEGQDNLEAHVFKYRSKTLKITDVVLVNETKSFAIYEDYRNGEKNPCTERNCSHLCLPTSKGYRCACPSGLTLVGGNRCKPSTIIYSTSDNVTYVATGGDVCSLEVDGGNSSRESAVSCTRNDIQDIISCLSGELSEKNVVLDPFGVGHLQLGKNRNCIEVYTHKTKEHSTLRCFPRMISHFAMDFTRSLVFLIQEPPISSDADQVIVGSYFPFHNEAYNRPFRFNAAGLAVDSMQERLYWLSLPDTLVSSKYDGSNENVVRSGIGFHSRPKLQFSQNWLIWQEPSANGSLVVAYDIDSRNVDLLLQTDAEETIDDFLVLPTVQPDNLHPCVASNCSHTCFPYSTNGYACGCPEPLIAVGHRCEGYELVLLSGQRNYSAHFKTINVRNVTVTPWLTLADNPGRIILHTRPVQRDTCWILQGRASVKCMAAGKKVSEIAKIHPETSMLVFDAAGKELFYNNGKPGNIMLKSVSTDSDVYFEPFSTPNITAWTLDTQKKIFFWSGAKLNFVALHKMQVGFVDIGGDSLEVSSMTLDTLSRVLYFVQGEHLKLISYKRIFSSPTNEMLSIRTTHTLQQIPTQNLGYYKHSLYWTLASESKSSVLRFNLLNSKETTLWEAEMKEKLFASFIVPPSTESDPQDPCATSHCSHFCFPVPPLEDSRCSYECDCPKSMQLINKHDCEDIPDSTGATVGTVIGAMLAIVAIAGLVVALVVKSRRNIQLAQLVEEIQNGNPGAVKTETNPVKKAENLPLTCIIPPSDLFVNESRVLGSGVFGIVLQGVYLNSIVAVKRLRPCVNVNLDHVADFAKEIKIMDYIGHHPNITRFYGVEVSNLKRGSMYAVMEFSRYGSLLSLLKKHASKRPSVPKEKPVVFVNNSRVMKNLSLNRNAGFETLGRMNAEQDSTCVVTEHLMMKWAEHIASGMDYLAGKHIVHGDLAARNILIFDNYVARICDFGMSRQLYNYDNYTKKSKVPLPWRWMAIESLESMDFSTKSDVWAYGITLWEIFTFGHVPYPQHEWTQNFIKLLRGGLIPHRPEAASKFLYDYIMKPCWFLRCEQRPSFDQILETFKALRHQRVLASDEDYELVETGGP